MLNSSLFCILIRFHFVATRQSLLPLSFCLNYIVSRKAAYILYLLSHTPDLRLKLNPNLFKHPHITYVCVTRSPWVKDVLNKSSFVNLCNDYKYSPNFIHLEPMLIWIYAGGISNYTCSRSLALFLKITFITKCSVKNYRVSAVVLIETHMIKQISWDI